MNKSLKLALLPAAVASAMFANNALAGTEACFEVYKGADGLAVAAFDTYYGEASCVDPRGGAAADDLAITAEGKIAYELTGNLDVNLDELDGTDTDQHIVYIPTTDIPGGTKIDMSLSGATFAGNSNQIHLVKYDEVAANGSFIAVASSDGTVDGTGTVTFLTKAGTIISAGTRLAFSLASSGADAAALVPVGLNISNNECTTDASSKVVTIRADKAVTDGGTGYKIEGGATADGESQLVLDISSQFVAFNGGTTAEADVNAESSSHVGDITARTEFVYDPSKVDALEVRQREVTFATHFYNREAALDQFIDLTADDYVKTTFTASTSAGSDVEMGIYDTQTAVTGVMADQIDAIDGSANSFGTIDGTTVHDTLASDLLIDTADDEADPAGTPVEAAAYHNTVFYTLTNTDPAAIMNFNYDVEIAHQLELDQGDNASTALDHCGGNVTSHEIGVNGAVLKVPYTYATWDRGQGVKENWVRITNEHSEAAEVTVEVFAQSALEGETGTASEVFTLGTVGGQDSAIYYAEDIANLYDAEVAGDNGNRFTFTFTVTAPKNTVHGVAVNKVGEADRVLPVLDQNDWKQ